MGGAHGGTGVQPMPAGTACLLPLPPASPLPHLPLRSHTPCPALQVLRRAAENGELVNVALNTHGTRAVQKLIETLTSREQVRGLSWAG